MIGPDMLPPYAHLLGLIIDGEREGAPVLRMDFGEHVVGRPGFLHGGAIGGLLEIASIVALYAAFDGEQPPPRLKPVSVTVDYMRGGRERETYAAGRILRLGRRIANLEAQAWQDDPTRPIASARMNVLIARD